MNKIICNVNLILNVTFKHQIKPDIINGTKSKKRRRAQ